jgi:hypothetical protein
MDIVNHTTGDICKLKYNAYTYFSRETPRKVSDSNHIENMNSGGHFAKSLKGQCHGSVTDFDPRESLGILQKT